MTDLLRVRGLTIRYGRVTAVETVDLEVAPGQVVAILGRNGAGKSSLLQAIAGGVRAAQGKVFWKGEDITGLSADARVRLGISLIPEGRRIFPHLTVLENLRLGGFRLSPTQFQRKLAAICERFPVLADRLESPARQLSGGQQQMLAIARALMTEPQLLLLDEPSLGLAPLVVDEVYALLEGLRQEGIGMVLVEQHVRRALDLADQALVLHLGRVVLRDAPANLAKDPRLVQAYLGAGESHAV